MKIASRRLRSVLALAITASFCSATVLTQAAFGQAARNSADEVIPVIVMDSVGLTDAIKNLARSAGLNFILDPKILSGRYDATGRPRPEPSLSFRMESVTAKEALAKVLKDHELVLVENPVTSVARIATAKQGVKPVDRSQVGSDTNAVVALITMEDVELVVAIQNLARSAGLVCVLDSKAPYGGVDATGRLRPQPMVSIRWAAITPRQALAALLDNYDLVMVQDPGTSTARITAKESANTNAVNQPQP